MAQHGPIAKNQPTSPLERDQRLEKGKRCPKLLPAQEESQRETGMGWDWSVHGRQRVVGGFSGGQGLGGLSWVPLAVGSERAVFRQAISEGLLRRV